MLERLPSPLLPRRSHRRDKSIPLPGHRLNESRALGVILQRLAQFPDRAPDAVVRVEENTFAPNPRDDFVPGDNLVPALNEQDKHLQRDALQLHHMLAAAQPPWAEVKLITFAEPDRLRLSDWGGSHGILPLVSGRILQHLADGQGKCKEWLHLARHKT